MASNIIALAPALKKKKNHRPPTTFDRKQLGIILSIYGQMVSAGHWKDYAIDMLPDRAVFSIYRKASEMPLYQIIKTPANRARQGEFSVVAPGGLIMKRGHDLRTVLRVFDRQRFK